MRVVEGGGRSRKAAGAERNAKLERAADGFSQTKSLRPTTAVTRHYRLAGGGKLKRVAFLFAVNSAVSLLEASVIPLE